MVGTRTKAIINLYENIIILSEGNTKPDYEHRFKKWYSKQKEQYERRRKGFELLLSCIENGAQSFVALDLLEEKQNEESQHE